MRLMLIRMSQRNSIRVVEEAAIHGSGATTMKTTKMMSGGVSLTMSLLASRESNRKLTPPTSKLVSTKVSFLTTH